MTDPIPDIERHYNAFIAKLNEQLHHTCPNISFTFADYAEMVRDGHLSGASRLDPQRMMAFVSIAGRNPIALKPIEVNRLDNTDVHRLTVDAERLCQEAKEVLGLDPPPEPPVIF